MTEFCVYGSYILSHILMLLFNVICICCLCTKKLPTTLLCTQPPPKINYTANFSYLPVYKPNYYCDNRSASRETPVCCSCAKLTLMCPRYTMTTLQEHNLGYLLCNSSLLALWDRLACIIVEYWTWDAIIEVSGTPSLSVKASLM